MEWPTFEQSLGLIVQQTGESLITRYQELVWKTDWQRELFSAYEEERIAIRKQMGLSPDLNEHRIDRHKIAAALTRAILRVQPLVARGRNPSPGARLANQNLTLLASMRLVVQMVAERLKTKAPADFGKICKKLLNFPPANDGAYATHYCKALYHNASKLIDALLLANTFFLLESYHLQALGVTCLPVMAGAEESALAD